MSRRSLKFDDLLDMIQDDRIVDVLTTRLKPNISASIQATVEANISATIEASFNKLADKFLSRLETIVEKVTNDHLSKFSETLHKKISALEEENSRLKVLLEESEKNTRLNNLVIHGIPESQSGGESNSMPTYLQSRQTAIRDGLDIFTTRLQLPVTEADISFAYRIPNKIKGAPRPLIVGFVGRRVRDLIFGARKALWGPPGSKSTSIFINDHLTRLNSLIFSKTRQLMKDQRIHSTWTAGGNVLIKLSNSSNEKPLKVISLQQLDDLLPSSSSFTHLAG